MPPLFISVVTSLISFGYLTCSGPVMFDEFIEWQKNQEEKRRAAAVGSAARKEEETTADVESALESDESDSATESESDDADTSS
jgi:hypothetical protein